jgi:DNA-directed RNA polymerase subunit RPC12/RpoP
MNYQCPKCQVNLRYKFKGVVRLTCPDCGVRLFRTVSAAELCAEGRIELELWCAAVVVLMVGMLFIRSSSYLFPVVAAAIVAFAAWRVLRLNSSTSADWPRWTDRAPW